MRKRPLVTVYAVDDDPDVLASLRFLLEAEGFAVKTFANGSDLLASSYLARAIASLSIIG